jgi:hypothetical protein
MLLADVTVIKKHNQLFMAKQLTERELRRQAVQALSDPLGPVDSSFSRAGAP